MKKNNKISYLLLSYNQNMYFSSIEEILLYVTNKNQKQQNIQLYELGTIDEYNRIIIKSEIYKLEIIKQEIESYGINCFIGNLDSDELKQKRYEYLKFKFPNRNILDLEKELETSYLQNKRIKLQYEPIILEVSDEAENTNEKKLFITYKQSKNWTSTKKSIKKIAKKYYSRKPEFDENWINKYNRLFYQSDDIQLLNKIQNDFQKEGVETIILDSEEEFIQYRMEYIKYHHSDRDAYFLHSKWKLEFLNGWFNREKWPPIIFVKKNY